MSTAPEIFNIIEDGNVNKLKDLVSTNSKVARSRNDSGQSPIIFAQFQQRDTLAEILMTAHPFLDIGEAAALGQLKRIKEILSLEPELMDSAVYDGMTPLHLASRFGQAEAVELLLALGSSPTISSRGDFGQLPIHCAVQSGCTETLEILLDAESSVDATDRVGKTPLHYAVKEDQTECLQVLLKYGGNPDILAYNGLSPREQATGETLKILSGIHQVFL